MAKGGQNYHNWVNNYPTGDWRRWIFLDNTYNQETYWFKSQILDFWGTVWDACMLQTDDIVPQPKSQICPSLPLPAPRLIMLLCTGHNARVKPLMECQPSHPCTVIAAASPAHGMYMTQSVPPVNWSPQIKNKQTTKCQPSHPHSNSQLVPPSKKTNN